MLEGRRCRRPSPSPNTPPRHHTSRSEALRSFQWDPGGTILTTPSNNDEIFARPFRSQAEACATCQPVHRHCRPTVFRRGPNPQKNPHPPPPPPLQLVPTSAETHLAFKPQLRPLRQPPLSPALFEIEDRSALQTLDPCLRPAATTRENRRHVQRPTRVPPRQLLDYSRGGNFRPLIEPHRTLPLKNTRWLRRSSCICSRRRCAP